MKVVAGAPSLPLGMTETKAVGLQEGLFFTSGNGQCPSPCPFLDSGLGRQGSLSIIFLPSFIPPFFLCFLTLEEN